jgi:hypothetical protein
MHTKSPTPSDSVPASDLLSEPMPTRQVATPKAVKPLAADSVWHGRPSHMVAMFFRPLVPSEVSRA